LANQAQDRIATSADAKLTSHVCSSLTPYHESKLAERCLQLCGALSVRTAEVWEAFHEDLLSTRALVTEETTHMQNEADGTPNGGKIT